MAKRQPPAPLEPRDFRSPEEIDQAIEKLERRIRDLERLDLVAVVRDHNGADDVVESAIRETIREVFGSTSPEFDEHRYIRVWAGPQFHEYGSRGCPRGPRARTCQGEGSVRRPHCPSDREKTRSSRRRHSTGIQLFRSIESYIRESLRLLETSFSTDITGRQSSMPRRLS